MILNLEVFIMSIGLNNTLNTIKDLISIFKELKPVLTFLTGGSELSSTHIRNIKLFLYYFLVVVFLMGMLASITLMLVNLPLFSGDLNKELVYKISDTAKNFMNNLVFVGYVLVFITLNAIFLFSVWHTVKRMIKKISNL